MNESLISRQAAIEALERIMSDYHLDGYEDERLLINALKDLPSAQPEIIRCKDCKHYIPYDWMFSGLSRSSNINNYFPDDMVCLVNDDNYPPDGFCSKAERKNDEAD
jgi:hypothetical protein